jgi:signal transduction histidine kinase/ActR/RegA family two-component response regulator
MSGTSPGRAMTVRSKLVLLTAVLLGGISAFIYLYFPGRAEERILRTVAAEARDISRVAAFSVAPALVFGDPTAGLELLKGADATTDVAYVVIVDAKGKLFAAIHEDRARRARYREPSSVSGITPDGSILRTALPILYESRRIGTLYAGLSLAPVRAEIAGMRRGIALASALVFLMGLLVAILIGTFVTRPLNQMVETTKEIARGQWQRRAPVHSLDEVGELAGSFNTMLDALERSRNELEELNRNLEQRVADRTSELEREVLERQSLEEQFRQAQKMEAVGRLAGGVAHDFNNLLTTILGYSHLILGQMEPHDPQRLDVEEIRKAGDRAAALTKQLLAFSRKQVIEPKVLEVNAVVANMEKMLCRLIGEDIRCVTELDSSAGHIKADLGQLEQVIMNIVVNARDAMPDRGKLTIQTGSADFDAAFVRQHVGAQLGQYASIVVSDTGCGMDHVTKLRIFEPFFTTKGPSKGTGLGMATVYGIVKQSEGYILVDSEPGQGTRISLYFPQVSTEGLVLDSAAAPIPLPGGSEIVLLVEDEDAVRSLVRGVLHARGYAVLDASNAAEAVRISNDFVGPIHVLLTDVVMPDVNGRELADQLKQTRPEMRLLYMSGYTEDQVVHHGVMTSDVGFLQKPFTPERLLRKLRETLDRRYDAVAVEMR